MRAPTFRPLALGAAAILAFGLVIGLGSDTSVSAAGEIKVTVCIMNSNGVHLVPGTTYYKIGSTAYFTGTLDANQCLNRDFPATTTNVEVWTTYNNTPSAHVTKNVAIDPVFTFQTRQVTLKLQTSDDAPLAGGTGKYGLGGAYGTWNFPGNPTNASGEVAAQLFPGVYSFEMSYQGTAQPKLSLTIPDADTTLVWETTTVTIAYPGQVSYGGPVGDSKWFKQTTATESKELLPSTVRFHLRGGITTDLTFSGDAFTYDAAPPMVGVSLVDPNGGEPDGSNGWFRTSPVSGKVEADDTLLGASPIQAIDCTGAAPTDFVGLGTAPFATAGFSVSAEGATTISCTATDSAGNTSPTPATRVVKIDTIAPTIVASATSAPNPNGWYPGPVTIHFVCSDGGSGIPAGNCPADEVLSGEGAGITSTQQTVTDAAGNTSAPSNVVTVAIGTGDLTPPVITITTPQDGAEYLLGSQVFADFECSDEAGGSGVASCVGLPVPDGSALDTTVGSHIFTVSATDKEGNPRSLTHSYDVLFDYDGFFSPVDELPAFNKVKAGAAVPVKFSLAGNQGLGIFEDNYPRSAQTSCQNIEEVDPIEETLTAGSSSLSYDPITDQYTYVWKTLKGWANDCRQFVMELTDGTYWRANFQFT